MPLLACLTSATVHVSAKRNQDCRVTFFVVFTHPHVSSYPAVDPQTRKVLTMNVNRHVITNIKRTVFALDNDATVSGRVFVLGLTSEEYLGRTRCAFLPVT